MIQDMKKYDLKEPLPPVWAFKIKKIERVSVGDVAKWRLIPHDANVPSVDVDDEFVERWDICNGDYYIVNGDGGITSMNGKRFEERYKSL